MTGFEVTIVIPFKDKTKDEIIADMQTKTLYDIFNESKEQGSIVSFQFMRVVVTTEEVKTLEPDTL